MVQKWFSQKRPPLGSFKRLVIKLGSSSVVGNGDFNIEFLEDLAWQVKKLMNNGVDVLIVTSGAVALGLRELQWKNSFVQLTIPQRQALAAVGQGLLLENYRKIFKKKQIHIGQILLSAGDLHRRDSFLHLRNAIETLLKSKIIPVMNENDSVAIEELTFGENDALSANVAIMVQADLLLIFSNVPGLLKDGRRIPWVFKVNKEILGLVNSTTSETGLGGMLSKVKAANLLMGIGKKTIIASFQEKNVIQRLLKNEDIGTLFFDPSAEDKWKGKRRWIALKKHPKGQILIDAGAARQIIEKGSSLLAKGITATKGNFQMGDLVEIIGSQGSVAQGLTHFSNDEIEKIRGAHSSEYSRILERSTYQTVVHRNNLVLIHNSL